VHICLEGIAATNQSNIPKSLAMRVLSLLPQAFLLLSAAQFGWAASSWTFTDGSVNVQSKGAGVGGGLKEK
jgi:hypothetical protein